MSLGYFSYPMPVNETVLSYVPGSTERELLKSVLEKLKSEEADIPMYIGSKEVRTTKKERIHPPHDVQHTLGYHSVGDEKHINLAIEAALNAKDAWARMSWEGRATIFLKAADLLSRQIHPHMSG